MRINEKTMDEVPLLILFCLNFKTDYDIQDMLEQLQFTLLEIKINRFSRYWSKLIGVKALPLVISLLRIVTSQILIINSIWPLFRHFRFGILNSIIKFDRIIFNECKVAFIF